jgi:hypothetical protein
MVQRDQGIWFHSAGRRRQRRVRQYLGRGKSWLHRLGRRREGELRRRCEPWQGIGGKLEAPLNGRQPARGVLVPRSHRLLLSSPLAQLGGFFLRFVGLGKSLVWPLRLLLIRRRRWDKARKSGGPTPFELSLKVQRDFAHNPPSGFEVLPRCCDLNVHEPRKVHPTRRRGESAAAGPCDGTGRALGSNPRQRPS